MLFGVAISILLLTTLARAECDIPAGTDAEKVSALRICRLENEVTVVQRALQEVMQQADVVLNDQAAPTVNKRKNEFIRFGKRSDEIEKRKNEFIRFGKRKNEFIRFGRSNTELDNDFSVEKRKNEFIRFG